MSAIARLYTGPEMQNMANERPQGELDCRIWAALATTVQWVANPQTRCCICDQPLNQRATYWAVLLPSDAALGLGVSGGVCGACGGTFPRASLQAFVDHTATLLFEEASGHA